MLVVETIARIRRDHLVKGVPIKKIARDLRVSKNTVRKVVRGDETSFSYARKNQSMPKLGPWVEGYILPRLWARRVPDVQRVDVASLHHDMRATPTNANRMLATLSRMFAVAELWQMRPDGSNPCRNIKHFREERRERFLSDEEYHRLARSCGKSSGRDRYGRRRSPRSAC